MKTIIKIWTAYLILAMGLFISLIFSCEGQGYEVTELHGRWYYFEPLGKWCEMDHYLLFNPDGTGNYVNADIPRPFSWEADDLNLVLDYNTYQVGYHYKIEYPMLRITTEIGEVQLYMHK